MIMRYFVHLAYNGKNYCGWQIQDQAPTLQSELEHAFSVLLKTPVSLTGAGRTDTGVHAKNFYAHFDMPDAIDMSLEQLTYKLNAFLPQDIVIYRIFPVKEEAHARFDAISRTYRYYVSLKKNPFHNEFYYRYYLPLDIETMNRCCQKMMQYTDFTSFSKLHTQTKTNNCTIYHAQWVRIDDESLYFEITANRFLRNMVRAIVGTLLDVGSGKITEEDFCRIIEQKNRCSAGTSVPANALFLEEIKYPKDF